ncbi:uncharacterized protein LOC111636906 [Centruroides sculpturatus]|uniref:uncharacterized protein LOC111636906 n=1 Tax=Centruroides sculpturatus TaxID=218467 RepID=UPI000C6EF068|nr:uncharacterized protein LOC111636906 [Centruroides sculpturatus]
MALRAALGVPLTTSLLAMYTEANYIGLKARLTLRTIRHMVTHISRGRFSSLYRIYSQRHGLDHYRWRRYQEPYVFRAVSHLRNLGIAIPNIYRQQNLPPTVEQMGSRINIDVFRTGSIRLPGEDRVAFDEWMRKYRDGWALIGTDGSKSPNRTSMGVFISEGRRSESWELDAQCGVFGAEAAGVLRGLALCSQNPCPTIICTDSRSVLEALANVGYTSDAIIIDIAAAVSSFPQPIVMLWTPGHVGIAPNEDADKAAKGANLTGSWRGPLLPKDIHRSVWQDTRNLLRDRWAAVHRNRGREYLRPFHPWPYHHASSRQAETLLAKLRTGTAPLNDFLYSRGIVPSPNCLFCGEAETTEHFWLRCPEYTTSRMDLLKHLRLNLQTVRTLSPLYWPQADMSSRYHVYLLEQYIHRSGRFNN